MKPLGFIPRSAGALLAFLLASAASGAFADDATGSMREAAKHFERGVALYNEADYPAALVEFKRAYGLAPNTAVLYNIAEAQFQLQDYASALTTFTRYLSEAPPGSAQRAEVESNLEILRARIGHLTVVTVPPGADVAIDDQLVGKTPLADRVLVSIGHRKVTASLPGHVTAVRYVDIAAGDDASAALELPISATGISPASAPGAHVIQVPPRDAPGSGGSGAAWRTVGWITTGMLAAGAAGTGALALKESRNLANERASYPVSATVLQADSDQTRTYSIVADSLTGAAVLMGVVTLIATVTSSSTPSRMEKTGAQLRVQPTAANLEIVF